jgi:Protein of unknown function (DUF2510)
VVAVMEGSEVRRAQNDRAPGWHPDHVNPNLQRYWDGTEWTATRRWMAGRWNDESVPAVDPSTVPPGARPQMQPAPFATAANAHRTTAVTAATVGLLLSSVLLIVGSFTPWITVSIGNMTVSGSGTDIAISHQFLVNGWFTLTAGGLLFVLACMIVSSGDALFHSLAVLISLLAAAFGVYALVRILQAISQAYPASVKVFALSPLKPDASVGWGLIVVLVGAAGAVLCAIGGRRE